MALHCDDVREILSPKGAPLPVSDERAEQVAEHLDQCADCNQRLSHLVGEVLSGVPVQGNPSLSAVRQLIREEGRQSFVLRIAAVAAALLVVLGTAWTLFRTDRTPSSPSQAATDRPAPIPPAEAPIPEPPKLADFKDLDRYVVQSEGVLALYLQFCLTCLNNPTDQDKQEYLTRALLIFREVRGRIRSEFERVSIPPPDINTVTLDALNDALKMVASSKLASVPLAPSKATAFKFEAPDRWRVDHQLGGTPYRLTLQGVPNYLNFAYVKLALGAPDALMARIEEALWFDSYVALPKRI